MTALAGIEVSSPVGDAGALCRAMLAAQSVYGPHAVDQITLGARAIGRCLYRLLPEDKYDHQPLVSADGRFALVADLRLDNRDELIAKLSIDPGAADHLCDAAVLLAAWSAWGEGCLSDVVGPYAFAIWDLSEASLRLARDPMGHRPLHYTHSPDGFAFASMPKGLHALPGVARRPDQERMLEFLALLPEHGPATFFEGISRVEPGCILTVRQGEVTSRRHWNPEPKPLGPIDLAACGEGLRNHLTRAVKAQLRGGGERVGAHLSGGLDSAAVVATAAPLLAEAGRRLTAFTAVPRAGYAGAPPAWRFVDEEPYAAATAGLFANVDHVLVEATGKMPTRAVDEDFYFFELPLMNLCNYDWFRTIGEKARVQGISVMLVAAMGNLTISYDGIERLSELVARGRWRTWWTTARAVVGAGTLRWRGVALNTLGPWIPGVLWDLLNRVRGAYAYDLANFTALSRKTIRKHNLKARAKARGFDVHGRPGLNGFRARVEALQGFDLGNYNKGALAYWGIDERDPTSDLRLVEFCLRMPAEFDLFEGVPRSLVRSAFAGRLPQVVLTERRRGYQAADWHEALTAGRDDLAAQIERLARVPEAAALLDIPRLRALVADWPSEGWERHQVLRPYRLALLRGLSAGHFLRKATGSNQ